MRRRDVVLGGAALAALAALAWLARPFAPGWWRALRAQGPRASAGDSVFPAESVPVLLAVADVIVPGDDEAPAASQTDLARQLETFVRASRSRTAFYQRRWPGFAARVRALAPGSGALPAADVIATHYERWYRRFREAPRGGDDTSRFAEQLRRDVLRVYYASPAGWASVGYGGPVRRLHP